MCACLGAATRARSSSSWLNLKLFPAPSAIPAVLCFAATGRLYRQINRMYAPTYDVLKQSGLYQALTEAGQLVAQREVDVSLAATPDAYAVVQPEIIPFISYPYEWSFSQLKQAALLTLAIEEQALKFDLSLKDSSAYNIQFVGTRPVMIDTLSFEPYVEGNPWVAYRQFCQHFLAPLALMSRVDVRLQQLLRAYLDGLPLDLASELLPASSRLNVGLLSHLHLHAGAQKRYARAIVPTRMARMGRTSFRGLIDNLRATVHKLNWQPAKTEWGDYYEHTNYGAAALDDKQRLVAEPARSHSTRSAAGVGFGGQYRRVQPPGQSAWLVYGGFGYRSGCG